jgi:hypothetical protein
MSAQRVLKKHILIPLIIAGAMLVPAIFIYPVYAATPQTGTISPSKGTSSADQEMLFTATYSDADGWQHIKQAYVLFNKTASSTESVYAYYARQANKLFLYDSSQQKSLGGYAPGSNNIIETPWGKLNCSKTTVSGTGNVLTITWAISFKSAFSGTKNSYLYICDIANAKNGWNKAGTWTISNNPPATGIISPSSGASDANQEVVFAAAYSDPDGWLNINTVYLLINKTASSTESVYAYYARQANKLFLYDSSQQKWLGGSIPGSADVIETPWGKLNCANTGVSGSSNTLTVNWAITFKPAFTGANNAYLLVSDMAGAKTGWNKVGTWTLPNAVPEPGTITPSSGASLIDQPLAFTATYQDSDGWLNIQYVYFLINTSTSGANCSWVYYNQNANKLYLRDDAGKAWLGGYAPGSANTIENSYVKLNCSQTTVQGQNTTLTVNWNITPKSTFTGPKNLYLYVKDDAGAYKNWTKKGTWTIQIPDTTPPAGTVTINSSDEYTDSTTVVLTLSAQDEQAGWGLDKMQLSNDNSNWTDPETYATSKLWTLTDGDGQKTVYARFSDKAGNTSGPASDTIILDTTPPVLSIDAPTTPTNKDIVLSYSATDNLTPSGEITISGDGSPYIKEGDYNITLSAKDKAGNVSTASVSFGIDKTPPAIIISSPPNGYFTNKTQVDLEGTVDAVAFSETRDLAEGQNTLTKSAADLAGNSSTESITVTRDTIAPVVIIASPEDNYITDQSQITVTYTADSVQKTKVFNLTEGQNTLTVEETDQAGNVGSDSVIVILDTGALIKADEGGTVVSSDGRVKIIVPAGALLADTRIKVTCPDPSGYQNVAPDDYSLYVVADCKPNNVIFYKPVQLIFTLDVPQIPGTPVYLGLYNEIEDKIELEEFSSFVSADNLTVPFLINHFSTYAAMSGMLSQGAPIGAQTKTPLPDLFTGSFSHSVPIAVPPGRKGIQPGLALQYRSSNPNSWTGVGWALNTGYITRQAKKGLPKYDDSLDTFTFVTESFATELVHLVDNLYQAKIEGGFLKFYKEAGDSWKVVSKDGSYMLFGGQDSSKEKGPNDKTFNWFLTKVADTNSNYITYDYSRYEGKCYLSRIEYTGNENARVSPRYRVDFYLEDRQDTWASYISGEKITTAKRLDRIEAYFDGGLVWEYRLGYDYSPDTGRSLLKTFTQSASDGTAFPTQRFEYQTK